jgi:hypothetical protein
MVCLACPSHNLPPSIAIFHAKLLVKRKYQKDKIISCFVKDSSNKIIGIKLNEITIKQHFIHHPRNEKERGHPLKVSCQEQGAKSRGQRGNPNINPKPIQMAVILTILKRKFFNNVRIKNPLCST